MFVSSLLFMANAQAYNLTLGASVVLGTNDVIPANCNVYFDDYSTPTHMGISVTIANLSTIGSPSAQLEVRRTTNPYASGTLENTYWIPPLSGLVDEDDGYFTTTRFLYVEKMDIDQYFSLYIPNPGGDTVMVNNHFFFRVPAGTCQ